MMGGSQGGIKVKSAKLKLIFAGAALAFAIAVVPCGGTVRAAEESISEQESQAPGLQDPEQQGETSGGETLPPSQPDNSLDEEKGTLSVQSGDTQSGGPQGSDSTSDAGEEGTDTAGETTEETETKPEEDTGTKPEQDTETEPAEETEKEPVYRLSNNRLYRTDDGTPFSGTGFARMENGGYYYVVNGRWNSSLDDIVKVTNVEGHNGEWWLVQNGRFSQINTVAKNSNGWTRRWMWYGSGTDTPASSGHGSTPTVGWGPSTRRMAIRYIQLASLTQDNALHKV